jgi:hypothetical protein
MTTTLDESGFDVAAEQATLGCLLHNPHALTSARLTSDDLCGTHGYVLRAIKRAAAKHDRPTPEMVLHELAVADDLGRMGGAPYLHELVSVACVPAQLGWYVNQLQQARTRRKAAEVARRVLQVVTTQADPDTLLDALGDSYAQLGDVIDGVSRISAVRVPADTFEDYIDVPDTRAPWVIPGMLQASERVVLTAFEGAGKSTLARQIAALTAAGRHPFAPKLAIPPKRTLLLDSENPPELLRRGLRRLVGPMLESDGLDLGGRAVVARDPANTLDVRTEAGYAGLCRLVEEHSAELLCAGPVYRLTDKRPGDTWEDVATGVQQALQKIAATYGVALFLEHHAGKTRDDGGKRGLDPYGSSLWLRWPEFGFGLRMDKNSDGNVFNLERFRGDREEGRVGWPDQLIREGHRGARPFWRADWEDPADKWALMGLCEEALREVS